jgi:hypothetical protein
VATHFDNDHVGGFASVFRCALVDRTTFLYERCLPEEIPKNRDTYSYLTFVQDFPGRRVVPEVCGRDHYC